MITLEETQQIQGGTTEKHAWNVLQINGMIFPVDLTWDSGRLQKGEKDLAYFGCRRDFEKNHNPDKDEKAYKLLCFSKEDINDRIDTRNPIKQREISEEDKKSIVFKAIEETYNKYEKIEGSLKAKEHVNKAIMNYIKEGKINNFTRQNDARGGLEKYINREDMINLLINEYVEDNELSYYQENKTNDVLASAIYETSNKYGKQHANKALKKYILENNTASFTRQNGARNNMNTLMLPQVALEKIIREMVEREVSTMDKTIILKENDTQILEKKYFAVNELEKVALPIEKQQGLINKAMQWIKRKLMEKKQNKDIQRENIKNDIQRQDNRQQNER